MHLIVRAWLHLQPAETEIWPQVSQKMSKDADTDPLAEGPAHFCLQSCLSTGLPKIKYSHAFLCMLVASHLGAEYNFGRQKKKKNTKKQKTST